MIDYFNRGIYDQICLLGIGVGIPLLVDNIFNKLLLNTFSFDKFIVVMSLIVPCSIIFFDANFGELNIERYYTATITQNILFSCSVISLSLNESRSIMSTIILLFGQFFFLIGAFFIVFNSLIVTMGIFTVLSAICIVISSGFVVYIILKDCWDDRLPSSSDSAFSSLYLGIFVLNIVVKLIFALIRFPTGKRAVYIVILNICCIVIIAMIHSIVTKFDTSLLQKTLMYKNNFVKFISHELRTPFNTVMVGLELLNQRYKTEDEKVNNILHDITDACKLSTEILNSLLIYDKVSSGDLRLKIESIDASALLLAVVEPFRIQFQNKNIELRINNTLPDSTVVEVDVQRFTQALSNLIGNAVNFTPAKGHVDINISIKLLKRKKRQLLISVKDSGLGMSQESLGNLLKDGIRFSPVEVQNANRSGLGIWIARSIMKAHRGNLEIESDGIPGNGSNFTMMLPLDQNLAALSSVKSSKKYLIKTKISTTAIVPVEQSDTFQRPLNIVIVDDSIVNRKMMARALEPYASQIIQCVNGEEVVNLCTNLSSPSDIDIIFMDSVMPIMSGVEATKKIRSMGLQMPIIGVTGNSTQEQVEEFEASGVNKVVIKPVTVEMLISFLKEMCYMSSSFYESFA